MALNGYSTNNYFHFLIDNLSQLEWRTDTLQLAAMPVILSGFPERAEAHQPFIPGARKLLDLDGARSAPFDGTLMFCVNIIPGAPYGRDTTQGGDFAEIVCRPSQFCKTSLTDLC